MSVEDKVGAKVRQLREMREISVEQMAEQSLCSVDILNRQFLRLLRSRLNIPQNVMYPDFEYA